MTIALTVEDLLLLAATLIGGGTALLVFAALHCKDCRDAARTQKLFHD